MANLRWLTPGCLLSLATLALSSPASAAVVWSATFEDGDLTEWMPGINNEGNVEVLGEQVYMGAYAGKITLHPDDLFGQYNQNRVDIQHQSTLTNEGDESWLSGHYFMPEDAKIRNQIGFYESNSSFQNVMDFWVEPKEGGGTTINFGVGFLGGEGAPDWSADFTIGVWHQIAIHVLWSQDAAAGRVDVWFDGVQVVTDLAAKTKADGNTLFYQTGLHRRDPAEFTDTIYLDNFIEADSFDDAGIMAPVSAGGSGGSGGGGGAGGSGGSAAGGGGSIAAGGTTMATGGTLSSAGASGSAPTAGSAGSATTGTAGAASNAAPSSAPESSSCSVVRRPTERGTFTPLSLVALLGLGAWRRRFRQDIRSTAE